jgi:hypothetical protein
MQQVIFEFNNFYKKWIMDAKPFLSKENECGTRRFDRASETIKPASPMAMGPDNLTTAGRLASDTPLDAIGAMDWRPHPR